MDAIINSSNGRVSIVSSDGATVTFENVEICEKKSCRGYQKKEVFILSYLHWLFTGNLEIKIRLPGQFEISEFSLPTLEGMQFFPYRVDFKNGNKTFFLWVVIVADKEGKLSVFARSKVKEINSPDGVWPFPGEMVRQNDIDNPNLVWERE